MRSIETGAGIAGKLREQSKSGQRLRLLFPPLFWSRLRVIQRPWVTREDALVALAGRHVNWTSLAVQQQRFL